MTHECPRATAEYPDNLGSQCSPRLGKLHTLTPTLLTMSHQIHSSFQKVTAISLVLFFAITGSAFGQGAYQKFVTAYLQKNFTECVAEGPKALEQFDHPDLWRILAECHCGTRNFAEASRVLERLAAAGVTYSLDTMKVFKDLMADKTYSSRLTVYRPGKPVKTAFELEDRLYIPEGIAHDKDGDRFLVGGLRNKIISVSPKGEQSNFFQPEGEEWSFTGIKVYGDDVYACAFSESGANANHGIMFQLDRKTGKKKNEYRVKDGPHLLNDLVKTKGGSIYVTDSKAGLVYELKDGSFRVLADSATYYYPNGIAIDEKSNRLYVAHSFGISVIDLTANKAAPLQTNGKAFVTSIDGLYFKDNSLIGLQSIRHASRVIRVGLDEKGGVKDFEEYYRISGLQGMPTTGTFVKDQFYFIANAYVRNVQPDKSVRDADKVQKSEIKVVTIR